MPQKKKELRKTKGGLPELQVEKYGKYYDFTTELCGFM